MHVHVFVGLSVSFLVLFVVVAIWLVVYCL